MEPYSIIQIVVEHEQSIYIRMQLWEHGHGYGHPSESAWEHGVWDSADQTWSIGEPVDEFEPHYLMHHYTSVKSAYVVHEGSGELHYTFTNAYGDYPCLLVVADPRLDQRDAAHVQYASGCTVAYTDPRSAIFHIGRFLYVTELYDRYMYGE